jgi:hypothetical protein
VLVEGLEICKNCGLIYNEKSSYYIHRMSIIHRNREPCKNITWEYSV